MAEVTRVVLVAATYTSLEAVIDALGEGEIVIRTSLSDLDVGLVTAGHSTVTALPEIDAATKAVRIIKPIESALQLYAHSVTGGNIYVQRMGPPIIMDTTGVSSS